MKLGRNSGERLARFRRRTGGHWGRSCVESRREFMEISKTCWEINEDYRVRGTTRELSIVKIRRATGRNKTSTIGKYLKGKERQRAEILPQKFGAVRSIFARGTINMPGGAGRRARGGGKSIHCFEETRRARSCASAGQRREFWRVDALLCVAAAAAAFALFSPFSFSLFLFRLLISFPHLLFSTRYAFCSFRSVFPHPRTRQSYVTDSRGPRPNYNLRRVISL